MGRVDKCWVWVRLGSGFEIFLGFRWGFEVFLWVWVGMTGSGLGLFIITFFPKIDPPYPFYCNFLGSVLVGFVIFFFKFGLGFWLPHPSLKWWYIFSTFNIFLLKFRVYFLFARNVKVLRKFNI